MSAAVSSAADIVGGGRHADGMAIKDWPDEVWPPERLGWERTAVQWLFNWVAPELRLTTAFHRHPLLLSHLVLHDIQAIIEGHRRAYASARRVLADAVGPESVNVALAVLVADAARWQERLRQTEAVHAMLALHCTDALPAQRQQAS